MKSFYSFTVRIFETEKTEEINPDSTLKKKIKFKYYNPKAKDVKFTGDFDNWELKQMNRNSSGVWVIAVDLAPGKYSYKFVVDGQWKKDPKNPNSQSDGFGGESSVLELK